MLGCSLVSFHFLWDILCSQAVHVTMKTILRLYFKLFISINQRWSLVHRWSFTKKFFKRVDNYKTPFLCKRLSMIESRDFRPCSALRCSGLLPLSTLGRSCTRRSRSRCWPLEIEYDKSLSVVRLNLLVIKDLPMTIAYTTATPMAMATMVLVSGCPTMENATTRATTMSTAMAIKARALMMR